MIRHVWCLDSFWNSNNNDIDTINLTMGVGQMNQLLWKATYATTRVYVMLLLFTVFTVSENTHMVYIIHMYNGSLPCSGKWLHYKYHTDHTLPDHYGLITCTFSDAGLWQGETRSCQSVYNTGTLCDGGHPLPQKAIQRKPGHQSILDISGQYLSFFGSVMVVGWGNVNWRKNKK